MSEPNSAHPDSERVEFAREGDGVYVFTPCDGARVFLLLDQAVPGARLRTVCPQDGLPWLIEFLADDEAECGVRPAWTEPDASTASRPSSPAPAGGPDA